VITNLGVVRNQPDRVQSETRSAFVARTPELLIHDADGKLVRDGRWIYYWDGENRLTRVITVAGPSSSLRRVESKYDALGRRVRQTSYVLSNGVWQVVEDLKFVSDPELFGRHIAELNATNNAPVRAYTWGLDLSETLDGAGGVGGLLWVRMATGPAAGTHFVCYDGNGNVWNLVSATTGTETARYEYGPFGEPLRLSGPAALSNPFRFSTKRAEDFTGLVLYEYRPYSPTSGRWLSRDPVHEPGLREVTKGSAAMVCREPSDDAPQRAEYQWASNSGLTYVDCLGLERRKWPRIPPSLPPIPSSIRLCRRDICKRGGNWDDWVVLGLANICSGHVFFLQVTGGHVKGVGHQGDAGPMPREEERLEEYPPRKCVTCLKVGKKLEHGKGKGKRGTEASDEEVWSCLANAPLLRPYHGLVNNCRSWARSAAERCGLLCGSI